MNLSEKEIQFCLECAKSGIKVEDIYSVVQKVAELCEPIVKLFIENIEYMQKIKQKGFEK